MDAKQQMRGSPTAPTMAALLRLPAKRLKPPPYLAESGYSKPSELERLRNIKWLMEELVEEKDYDT